MGRGPEPPLRPLLIGWEALSWRPGTNERTPPLQPLHAEALVHSIQLLGVGAEERSVENLENRRVRVKVVFIIWMPLTFTADGRRGQR
jgi:hypothetical protein